MTNNFTNEKNTEIFAQLENGLFKATGWLNSFHQKQSLDENNQPVFWYSHSAIHFLKSRLQKHFSVFEYGSGNSTLCYAKYCARVVAIESDENWFEKMQSKIPQNVTLILQKNLVKFPEEIKNFADKFDIICIDSKERIRCLKACLNNISSNGIIIFDDMERGIYDIHLDFLKIEGFKRLDFFGSSPINTTAKITSIFYRYDNVLGL